MVAWKKAVMALVGAGAVAGAGWWIWQKQSSPGLPSSAEIGGEQAAFALLDCKARLFDGSPAIALSFTQPLDGRQDFAALVTAQEGAAPTVDGDKKTPPPDASFKPLAARWVLGDNPRVLYLPFVTPDRSYRIAFKQELAARGGAKLATAQACEAVSEAMPDSYYFASRGLVLPAGQNGGLPVVTVNTPEVDVQFLRIKPASLPAFLEQVGGRRERTNASAGEEGCEEGCYYDGYGDNQRRLKGTVGGWVLDELRAMSESVYLGRFTTDARPNRRNVSFLPVEGIKELQEPGIYVAIMNQPGRFGWDYQVTHYYVTDVGLHLRRHAAQIDVFATSLKSGGALSGVELSLVDEAGKALAQAQTDGDGHAVFTGKTDKARAVLARRGKEMSVLSLRDAALDLSEFEATGHPSRSNKLFVYAGRDLYRPGETFQVSVLARDADGKPLPKPLPITLTVKKPDGSKLVEQLVQPGKTGSGYYQQGITLPADAPTGGWTVQARIDPAAKTPDTQWAFKVEEFLPERMKLTLTAPEGTLTGEAGLTVQAQGDYLYGAPAAGNRLQGSAYAERLLMPLPAKLPGFIFGDLADDKAKGRQDLEEQELDAEGKASMAIATAFGERKSPMRIRAAFSLLESGGRPVVRTLERSWWPAPVLVAARPLFDRNVAPEGGLAEFELARVDAAGNFKPAKEVQLKLIYEERQWYWRYDDGRGWHSGFNVSEELVEARTLALKERTKIALPVRWGRYRLEVTDPETGLALRHGFYAGYGAQDADDIGNRPDRVQLKLQGAPFKPGDVAKLAIKPPHDGEAVVTVEGDRVLWTKRIPVKAKGTDIDIPVDAAWARHDLYITVAAFRPGSQGDKVTPARALGLVHLPLNREDRKPKLALAVPAKTQPSVPLPVSVKVPALGGKPAIVTVSAVDVGILNITNYKTPDPADFFFGKHRYGADLLDLYGRLIEKMEGNVAKQRFGGDAGKRDTQSMPRKVLLVDLFSGPVQLDAKGEATINLKLPDFNGTLRVMAVVSSADSYASAQAETVVAAPLVAELNMPRFVSPGDKATIALDVTNLSGAPQEVKVAVTSSGPIKISGITGSAEPIKLADKQRQILRFQAEALDAYGLAPIQVKVSAGALNLVREAALQVQPVTPLVRESRRIRLEAGATQALDKTLLDAFWAGSASVSLSVSNTPPIDIKDQVQGLLMYPYGCLEQTTSSAYPLVFIDDEAARRWGLKPVPREERAKRLDGAFARLASMQQPKGGYGLWASGNPYEAWLTPYVTGFLQDARDAGFNVPEAMLKRSLDNLLEQFQRSPAQQTTPAKAPRRDDKGRIADWRDAETLRLAHQRFAEAAHGGYILAREQKAPLATLRTLHDQFRSHALSPLPLVHLSLALKLMGDENRAKAALDDAMTRGYGYQPDDPNNHWGQWLGDYGSKVRDRALAYALLLRHKVAHEKRENLLFDLSEDFSRRNYYSTQERLALFLAVQAATHGAGKDDGWKAALSVGAKSDAWTGTGVGQQSFELGQLRSGIALKNDGSTPLYLDVTAQGYPTKPLPPTSDRISVERAMFTTDGKPATARQFTTGEMFVVRLRVKASQSIKDGLVVDRIPAGFEIENLNLSQGPQAGEFTVEGVNIAQANANERIVHTEYRDDRFVAAAQLGQPLDLFYLVRVVTPGRYVVPATFAEDMYRPEIRGIGKAEGEITVVDKK
jgi:alpha-2-macroglobulin